VYNPETVRQVIDNLAAKNYLADESLARAVFHAARAHIPLLLEGAPGVGKTALAKALSEVVNRGFFRLQCYEGITAAHALYDWNFRAQILELRKAELDNRPGSDVDLFSEEFLLGRPMLQAFRREGSVLLIDEIDRADDEFEAFLLEGLSEGKISIPEMSPPLEGMQLPLVVITSNGTRDIHEALRRRCAYHWIEHPTREREADILQRTVEGDLTAGLAKEIADFFAAVRGTNEKLDFIPGVSASREVAAAALATGTTSLTRAFLEDVLCLIAKSHGDQPKVAGMIRGSYR